VTLTKLQKEVQGHLLSADGSESLLLVAPTGIGKTLAVTEDLSRGRKRIIYGVPLRALASGISEEVRSLRRNGTPVQAVVHHGDVQDSWLFSEEVVVTTYDQIVCAVPGLPLSLPLSAGHAVAGALLMSRLVLDEVHLAWGISPEALTILLGILEFRQNLGLQTVVMTATMPRKVAELIRDRLHLKLVFAGDDQTKGDEALLARKRNRFVRVEQLKVKGRKSDEKELDLTQAADELRKRGGKRIYFANTVERLHRMYDLLESVGLDTEQITVLHNRMPGPWRSKAEGVVRQRFGKNGLDGDWVLLTNQVAEAGLDISAPFVLSDPAPVDTLVQRAGRCARWFRQQRADGVFVVISPPKIDLRIWALPYRDEPVAVTLDTLKDIFGKGAERTLDWETEQNWINKAWSGDKKKDGTEQVGDCLQRTTFALNLFDRAAQQHSPGAIASTFREILSTEVAVFDAAAGQTVENLLPKLKSGWGLDSSATSLRTGYRLIKNARGRAKVVRYQGDELFIEDAPAYLAPGELLLVPSSVAYLHSPKGLCFGDGSQVEGAILASELVPRPLRPGRHSSASRPQSLWEHTEGVMKGVEGKLSAEGDYRTALGKVLSRLEPGGDLVDVIARLAKLATGFHDLGKSGRRWQQRAHEIDPGSSEELIGRTAITAKRMGVAHTPPGFFAAVAACNAALGNLAEADHLVRAIALAAARHHSSLLDPSGVRDYEFDPVEAASVFVRQVLAATGLDLDATRIIEAARAGGTSGDVPLMLPNDDLFPIYALVGRAILISDREDAAGQTLEDWRSAPSA
jgi:CRISPR-associated endonuclease/helicase Cas3